MVLWAVLVVWGTTLVGVAWWAARTVREEGARMVRAVTRLADVPGRAAGLGGEAARLRTRLRTHGPGGALPGAHAG